MSVSTTAKTSNPVRKRLRELNADPGIIGLLRTLAVGGLVLAPFATLVGQALRAAEPPSDPDTWWHLVVGGKFLDGTSITHPGPISYFATEDWRPRDWLTQVVAAAFENWFGLPGVAWLYGIGLIVFVLMLYRVCRRRASFAATAIVVTLATLGAGGSLTARPQLVSFILLTVAVGAVLASGEDLRARWWLAPLTAVWACVHGMWFLSVVVQAAGLLGLLLDRRLAWREALRLAGVMMASVALVGITPNGAATLRRPLGSNVVLFEYIQEYRAPELTSGHYLSTLLLVGLTCLAWITTSQRPSWVELLLLALAVGFTLQMARTIPLGAVIAAPLCAGALTVSLRRFDLAPRRWVERAAVYGGASCAVVLLTVLVPTLAAQPPDRFTPAFDEHLSQLPEEAVLLNELGDGGYLMWKHPDLHTVIDGLSDQFATQHSLAVFRALELEPGWESTLERTHPTHALLRVETPLSSVLRVEGWATLAAYDDKVLLSRPVAQRPTP